MKFKEKLEDVDCLQSIIFTLLCLFGIFFTFISSLFDLEDTSSKIVFHDYGQTFLSIDDWRDWRLDHEGK